MLSNNAGFEDGTPTTWEAPELTANERLDCEIAAQTLKHMLHPASKEAVAMVLGKLKLHCRNVPQHTDGQWRIIFGDIHRDLAECPLDIIEAAVDAWRRAEPWWPHPSDLLKLAQPMLDERRRQFDRAAALATPQEKPGEYVGQGGGRIKTYGAQRQQRQSFTPDPPEVKEATVERIAAELARLKAMPGPG